MLATQRQANPRTTSPTLGSTNSPRSFLVRGQEVCNCPNWKNPQNFPTRRMRGAAPSTKHERDHRVTRVAPSGNYRGELLGTQHKFRSPKTLDLGQAQESCSQFRNGEGLGRKTLIDSFHGYQFVLAVSALESTPVGRKLT